MSAGKIGALAIGVAVVVFGIMVAIWAIGVSNHEIELRALASAQQMKNENIYQKVWTVIKQKAQVTDKYASDFKGIYAGLMDSRYKGDEGDNPTFKWIHEQNPQFSSEMYKDLSDAISGLRAEFAMVQNRLIDIDKEHVILRTTLPTSWVVGKRKPLDIVIVTSSKTIEVFRLGEENNVDVF